MALDNDALHCEESALLHHERINARKRAVEIERIKQTVAARAALEASQKKELRKKKRNESKPSPVMPSHSHTSGRWWETSQPLGETFQFTANEIDVDERHNDDVSRDMTCTDKEKMFFQARVFVDNIIYCGCERVVNLRIRGKGLT